ncbi:MAG: hypothetical protein V4725_10650 [Bacteroidota bacterium]
MKFFSLALLLSFFVSMGESAAQNYQAIHGSSYAGSLGIANNPASILHVPYAWDITPASLQFKQATNAFRITKYSFLSGPGAAEIESTNGTFKRFVYANQDLRLLNARITLNSKLAIALGANLRNYQYASTSTSNWQDTTFYMGEYMKINLEHLPLSGEVRATSWAELYASVSHIILDKGNWLLNAGVTLKLNRTLVGGYMRTSDLHYDQVSDNNGSYYLLKSGNLQYGYSRNFDVLDTNKTNRQNKRDFLSDPSYSVGADFGIEYIRLAPEDMEEQSAFAYQTKLGISLLDVGRNRFKYGSSSRVVVAGRAGITDTIINNKFVGVNSFDSFNDSIAGLAQSFTELNGQFSVYMPARLVVNLDQHITQNFFINAEVTIQLSALVNKNVIAIRDMNLAALTPRWEMKAVGVYLPIVYNTRKQLWVGGAFKAGPVLFGTHNLANLFAKNQTQNGGLYLAFTIRPAKMYDRATHDPGNKLSRKAMRRLNCPKF